MYGSFRVIVISRFCTQKHGRQALWQAVAIHSCRATARIKSCRHCLHHLLLLNGSNHQQNNLGIVLRLHIASPTLWINVPFNSMGLKHSISVCTPRMTWLLGFECIHLANLRLCTEVALITQRCTTVLVCSVVVTRLMCPNVGPIMVFRPVGSICWLQVITLVAVVVRIRTIILTTVLVVVVVVPCFWPPWFPRLLLLLLLPWL